jgi:hypothetical protein
LNSLKSILILTLFHFLLLCIPQGLQAQLDPKIQWKEIETETAYWIFDAKHQEVAEFYIMRFEQAKDQVLKIFKEPSHKISILLLDNTDLANGAAQVSPQPTMTLYLVRPTADSSIGEFKDPIYELLVHEYTHILNMDPVHGFITPLKWVFGSAAHPNMILPRWYTEGLATYTESLVSKTGGRLNSQYLQGLGRSLTIENKWQDYPLSDLNDFHIDWIGGSRAYLFGGILWENIARENGIDSVYKFNQSFSRRIPYLLDGVSEAHTGKDFDELLAQAYQFWQLQAQKQIEIITNAPQVNGILVNDEVGSLTYPSISPDGLWLVNYSSDIEGDGDIYLTLRHPQKGFTENKANKIIKKTQGQTLAWHPAATGFVYEKLDTYKSYYRFYDLYFYNLESKSSSPITQGRRAHHPCFSAQGQFLYYLENTPQSKRIVSMNWQTKETQTLYEAPIGDDIRYLSCPNSKSLLFIEHKAGEKPWISRLNIKSKVKTIAFDKYSAKFLKLTSRGALFVSDDSGVDNLYLLNKSNTAKPRAITNTLTRITHGELDPLDDGLYISQLTAKGPKLYYFKKSQWESLADTPPKVEPILSFNHDKNKIYQKEDSLTSPSEPLLTSETDEGAPHKTITKMEPNTARDFSPWRYLYPTYWMPYLYLLDGGTLYQALTSAGDPLGINTISLVGQWDTLTKKGGGSVSYLNNSLPVTLGLGVSDFYSFYYATRTSLHFSSGSFLMSAPLSFIKNSKVMLKWNYTSLDTPLALYIEQGPQTEFSYRSMKQNKNDISPSEGWRFQLGHKNYFADLGTIYYAETYSHVGTFWSSFTPKRHVLYLGVNGSYAPALNNGFFATSTLAGPFLNPQNINTTFLQRGYPTGIFIARNIVNTNLEYRFPMLDLYSGFTSPPLFFKNLQGALVFDATSLDGRYSNSLIRSSLPTQFGRWFTGYGLELESKVSVGFHVPVSFTLGLYYGQEKDAFGGFTTFFNIRL